MISIQGESGEAEPVEGNHRVQGTDSDLMDGETEGDTVVIAGQPEVLSTQAMQVIEIILCTILKYFTTLPPAKHCNEWPQHKSGRDNFTYFSTLWLT